MKTVNGQSQRSQLSLLMCTALVIGNMIGSGIFLLPASLAHYGGISIIAWLYTAAGAAILAIVFSRLSRLISGSGGPYVYTHAGFGKFPGFLVAWGYWISTWCGNAAISTAMIAYLGIFFPILRTNPILACFIALAVVWLLSWINIRGIRQAGFVQVITTVMKIIPLLAIGFLGIFHIRLEHFTPFNLSGTSSFSAITGAAAITLWAFLGLESASIPANNVKSPKTTIPRATLIGTFTVSIIYILGTVAVMGVIPFEELANSSAPFADAARIFWGDWAAYAVAAGAVISCFGALNGWIMMQGQLPLAAAADGLFPQSFSRLSKKGTPIFGIIFSSLLMTLLLIMNFTKGLVEKFTFIIMLATLATLVPYLFCSIAELAVRLKHNELPTGRRMMSLLFISIFSLAYTLWAIAGLGTKILMWGLILLASGIPVFLWTQKNKTR